MPFTDLLAQLCRDVPGALGAVFVDDEGENVQRHVAHPSLTTYDLDVAGAYVTPLVGWASAWRVLAVRGETGTFIACVVKDRYILVLLMGGHGSTGLARRAVQEAADRLRTLM